MKRLIATGVLALAGVTILVSYTYRPSNDKTEKSKKYLTCEQISTTCPGTGGPAYYCRWQGQSPAPDCQLTPQEECDPQIICR